MIDEVTNERISDANLNFNSMAAAIKNQSSGGISGTTVLSLTPVEIDGNTYYVFNGDAQKSAMTNSPKTATSKSCDLQVNVTPGDVYQITVQKDGYEPWQASIPANDLSSVPEYLIPLKKVKKPNTLSGTIIKQKTGNPLGPATVVVVNKCNGERMEFQTNQTGKFQMDVDCNCDYEISATKKDFSDNDKTVSSTIIGCDGTNTTTELALKPKEPKKTDFTVGKVIRLDKLYYDFNKYNIRANAGIELDKVVDLLKEYPSMEIELGSHTDSRVKDSYNEWLSRKRAEAAVQYIISKGISSSRVTAAGFGEANW
ncbi:MAG: OmpA family protein [Saprospiraceae bacterium]|nr:OmpA family protein [Saprospiraceae bacterium]